MSITNLPINNYYVGAGVRISATFLDLTSTLVDPVTVTARVLNPQGLETVYDGDTLDHDSTGKYHLDIVANASGYWHYRIEGTGADPEPAVKEGRFYVYPTKFDV